MNKDWVKVYESGNTVSSQIVLAMLLENEIEAVEINKIDSSYTVFGTAQIYCKPEQAMLATHLINTQE